MAFLKNIIDIITNYETIHRYRRSSQCRKKHAF
jgi:hypothetical protein